MKKIKGWNLKFMEEDVVSATECTGLMPALPDTDAEAKAVKDIYKIPD